MAASRGSSTWAGSRPPIPPSTWSLAGTCSKPARADASARELGCDDLEWERGKAWALQQAMGVVWYYRRSNPEMHAMGIRTLERILADES